MKLSTLLRPFQSHLAPQDASAQVAPRSTEVGVDRLANAALGQPCEVIAIHAPAGSPDWARWLGEIGFIPGESATVRARSPWGDGALVVRIGVSNFALRREEAACVAIKPL
jgi:ferrous iron transport protein A